MIRKKVSILAFFSLAFCSFSYSLSPDLAMTHAIANSNKKSIERLLRQGFNINKKSINGDTPLMFAAEMRIESMVPFLITKGADVNIRGQRGYTALIYAVGVSDQAIENRTTADAKFRIAKALVTAKADVKAVDTLTKSSVLHHATFGKTSLKMIQYLVEKGAPVNAKTKYGKSVLMYSTRTLNYKIVQYLIQKGASVKMKDSDGNTALMLAIDALNQLSLQDVENSKKYDQYLMVIDVLLKNGADIHMKDKKGTYPLHRMTRIDSPLLKYLINKGAKVNEKDQYGDTILTRVEKHFQKGFLDEKHYKDIKKFLLARGATGRSIDSSSTKYLFGAITAGSLSRVKQSLAKGADINGYNEVGETPLIASIRMMQYPIARYLIARGADVNGKTKDGTPALMAIQGTDYTVYYNYRSLKYYTILLNSGADVNARDAQGRTSAMFAVKTVDFAVLKLLSAKNADFTIQDNNGDTVVHYITRNISSEENFAAIDYLLAHGANIDTRNNKGLTPLWMAIKYSHEGRVIYLLKKGANPNLKDKKGNTALGFVKSLPSRYKFDKERNQKMIAILKKYGGR